MTTAKFSKSVKVENLLVGHRTVAGFDAIYEVRGIVAPHGLSHPQAPIEVHLVRVEGTQGDETAIVKTNLTGGSFSVVSDASGKLFRNCLDRENLTTGEVVPAGTEVR